MSEFVWDNPSAYRKCRKKAHFAKVCRPPNGTVVINSFEHPDIVRALKGRTYITVSEMAKIKYSNNQVLTLLMSAARQHKLYAVSDATPYVVMGVAGELYCLSEQTLVSRYYWVDTAMSDNATRVFNPKVLHWAKSGWIPVKPRTDNTSAFACFVPVSISGQLRTTWGTELSINMRGAGISHGKGDFVIAADINGSPSMQDRWVVNGELFGFLYDKRGWSECLSADIALRDMRLLPEPKLF